MQRIKFLKRLQEIGVTKNQRKIKMARYKFTLDKLIEKLKAETNMNIGNNDMEINTSSWANGIYFVTLNVGKRIINAKLLVSHN